MDQYDEFGNYIGGDLPEDFEDEGAGGLLGGEDSDVDEPEWMRAEAGGGAGSTAIVAHGAYAEPGAAAIVLAEDKKYYPDAEEVYPDAEVLVEDQDAQHISEPIIAPVSTTTFSTLTSEPPSTVASPAFMASLMASPALIRNVAVAGHLHHGKTLLLDALLQATYVPEASTGTAAWPLDKEVRYTDTRKDEQERGMSIKSTPLALVVPDSRHKSFLVNAIDVPGHVNFSDEASAAFRLADGLVLVVDALEGVMLNTERLLRHAVEAGLAVTLVINKLDRLILELKLPPADAYFKIAQIIHEVNGLLASAAAGRASASGRGGASAPPAAAAPLPLSPARGNVLFAAATHGWSFTLESFAAVYSARWAGGRIKASDLAPRLWGDVYYDPSTRKFNRKPHAPGAPRSFVQFVLEPLYKLYSQVLGEEVPTLQATLASLGLHLRKSELLLDPSPLLRLVLTRLFGDATGFGDMVTRFIPSPAEAAASKVAATYSGALAPEANLAVAAMLACDASGPLMVNVVKLYSTPSAQSFLALGRVLSGTVCPGAPVRVLGESYSLEDDEDMAVRTVTGVSLSQGRYLQAVSQATAGNLVLLEGIDDVISKTATVTFLPPPGLDPEADVAVFAPLRFNTKAVVTLAVEPLNPTDLPKVLDGLRKVCKSYPLASTRVEESGEHVLVATGELAMDSMMHDLRVMYSGVEVKVSDPATSFCETVSETSTIKCFGATANKKNRLTMVCEPLQKGLAEDIEGGVVSASWNRRELASFFTTHYDWDALAARSVWAFGPTDAGPNVLVDDTLPSEVDKALLGTVKESIVQGFKWGTREGPLCDEPVRGVKCKLLDVSLAGEALHRGGGQIIPTARRVAYSAFLLASPRLMEPVYAVEVLCPADAIQAVYAVLGRRRGHVTSEAPKPGTPFFVVKGFLPVMDSFGFETDLRVHTQGAAFGLQVFDHWEVVPGDPLDASIALRPLEPAPPLGLAREFMLKTRRRKGLAEDVSITKYFDDDMLAALVASEEEAM